MTHRRAFTIIEALMAMLIVSVALVATLTAASRSIMLRSRTGERARAEQLALDLLSEILQQSYEDPVQTPVFGLEPGESVTLRAAWNDVDDYNGWTETPPQTKSGSIIPDATGLTRSVLVQWIDPATLLPTGSTKTGIKLITVSVLRGSLTLATVSAYRTIGWVDTLPAPTDATGNHSPAAAASLAQGAKSSDHIPFTTSFDGTSSSDPDGDTLSYVWNLGDGTTTAGTSISHTYNTIGTYTVSLTVYDGRGGVGVSSLTVTATP